MPPATMAAGSQWLASSCYLFAAPAPFVPVSLCCSFCSCGWASGRVTETVKGNSQEDLIILSREEDIGDESDDEETIMKYFLYALCYARGSPGVGGGEKNPR